jgi:hypothetical protein
VAKITLPILTEAAEIATDKYPLRASALPKINECPASVFLSTSFWIESDDDEPGGQAAQTGNLVHAAAAVYHREPGSLHQRTEAGLAALEAARAQFPGGEVKRAKKIWEAYAADPANAEAQVVRGEQRVKIRIPCAPFDPTGKEVVIRGTLDQLRLDKDGVLRVYDIKTGTFYYGRKALDHYLTQQAAYVLGAQQTWGQEFPGKVIEPGALICTDGYFRDSKQVFWHHPWGLESIPNILQSVVTQVAAARAGRLGFQPSTDACRWCEHKNFPACEGFYTDHVK